MTLEEIEQKIKNGNITVSDTGTILKDLVSMIPEYYSAELTDYLKNICYNLIENHLEESYKRLGMCKKAVDNLPETKILDRI